MTSGALGIVLQSPFLDKQTHNANNQLTSNTIFYRTL